MTFPIVKPIFLILTSLSIIWDFGVFTQPFLLIDQTRINASNELMGIYLYEEGYVKTDFGRGAAISILMLLIVAVLSIFYVRKMVRTGGRGGVRARRAPAHARCVWDAIGLVLFLVIAFPVYWMVASAFKPDDELNGVHADLVLGPPDARRTSATRSTGPSSGTASRTA